MKRFTLTVAFAAALVVFLASLAYAIHWKKIETSELIIYSQKESLGREALVVAQAELERISRFFRYKPSHQIDIYVYNDPRAFRSVAPSRTAIGFAKPFSDEIAVLATESDLRNTISHELVHIIFLRSIPSLKGIPFWFVEGIAYYLSESRLERVNLERDALQGDIGHLEELGGNLSPREEKKAAAEGYLITRFLAEKFGLGRLQAMVFVMQKGKSFYTALQVTTGLTEQALDEQWHRYGRVEKRIVFWEELRFSGFLILALLAVLSPVFWLIKIKRRLGAEENTEEDGEAGGALP